MQHATQCIVVTFKTPAAKAASPDIGPYHEELERFSAADPRWRNVIEMGAATLSESARRTLGVALSGLVVGPAPKLMSFDFGPDEAEAMEREMRHMEDRLLSGLGVLTAARLGLGSDEIAKVQGIVTGIHRLLRVAKTRP